MEKGIKRVFKDKDRDTEGIMKGYKEQKGRIRSIQLWTLNK